MTKKNNKAKQTIKYVVVDWLCALIAWVLFFFFRKYNEDPSFHEHYHIVFQDINFLESYNLDVPDLVRFTKLAKDKKVRLSYHKDILDLIKDVYKHV